jgi:hypothetical protein
MPDGVGVNVSMEGGGQVSCHDCEVRVKFDDKQPSFIPADGSNDGSADYLFFENDAALATKLRGAQTMTVEIPLYDEGDPAVTFDVSGLTWPIPSRPEPEGPTPPAVG